MDPVPIRVNLERVSCPIPVEQVVADGLRFFMTIPWSRGRSSLTEVFQTAMPRQDGVGPFSLGPAPLPHWLT